MKKTLIAFILIFAMLLTSCATTGSNGNETSGTTENGQSTEPISEKYKEISEMLTEFYPVLNSETDKWETAFSDKAITFHIPLINFTEKEFFLTYHDPDGKKNGHVHFEFGEFLYKADDGYDLDTISVTGAKFPKCYGNGLRNLFPSSVERTNVIDGSRTTKTGYKYYYQICIPDYNSEPNSDEYAETVWFVLEDKYYVSFGYSMGVALFDEWMECLDNITFDVYYQRVEID